jgi:hypothetical protein
MVDRALASAATCGRMLAKVMSDSDYGPGPLSGNPPSVAGCPG